MTDSELILLYENALLYIKNKGFDINDKTGNWLGVIAQRTLLVKSDIQEGKWATTSMICELCEHKWQAVHPASCKVLECPKCKYANEII